MATPGSGSYDVAVSGAGNLYFHPLMAGSGYDGSTGALQPTRLGAGARPRHRRGPALLASDPTAGASLASSPLAIRLDLSGPLDPTTVAAGSTVRLLYSATGTFGDGNDVDVPLASVNFSTTVNELQLFPQAALEPGDYRVVLSGDSSSARQCWRVPTAPRSAPMRTIPRARTWRSRSA